MLYSECSYLTTDKDDFDFKNHFANDTNEEEKVMMDQWDDRLQKQDKMLEEIIPALKELELVMPTHCIPNYTNTILM